MSPPDIPIYADASADPAPEQMQDDDDGGEPEPIPGDGGDDGGPVFRMRVRRMHAGASLSDLDGATGSSERLFGRIWAMPFRSVQLGGVAEKDPGESVRHGFASGFLRVGRQQGGMGFIIGDYRVAAGSGALLGRPSFSSPGARLFPGPGMGTGPVRPHSSADESRYFRGVAAWVPLSLGSWSAHAAIFASSARRSGRIDSSGTFSPYVSGLFRTPAELRKWNTNRERLGGFVLSGRRAGFRLAAAGLWTAYAYPIQTQQGRLAPLSTWASGSIEAGFTGDGLELSGEVARACATSLTFEGRVVPSHHLTAVIQIQSIRPGYQAPYGSGLSGRPAEENMSICDLGCLVRPARWAKGALFASVITSDEPRAHDPLPGTRVRFSAEADLSLTPAWSVLLFAGATRGEDGITVSDPDGRSLRVMRGDDRSTLRIQSLVDGAGQWSLRNRCDIVTASRASHGARERGILLQADFKCRVAPGVRVAMRGSLFDVDGWGARIYSAEQDVEGAMRIPVFVGRGVRLYALLRWEAARGVALSARYGVTFQDGVPRGTSLEANAADEERELSLQLDAAW